VLFARLNKALYGTLRAAPLFWKKLTMPLREWGFQINPYHTCMANTQIDGLQYTIIWQVNDLKISHQDPEVVTSVVKKLTKIFGNKSV
jgi:hypothetical protein